MDPDREGMVSKPSASIPIPAKDWTDYFEAGREVLAYGFWRAKRRAMSGRFAYLNLNLYPQNKGQVLAL